MRSICWNASLVMVFGGLLTTVCCINERQLFKDLFDDHVSAVRPRKDPMEVLEIAIELELHQMKELDEKSEVFSTIGFIEATWHDDYLSWDPANYSGITELVVPPTYVWLPDFGIQNSAQAFYDETYYEYFRVWVDNNGTVKWSYGGLFQTACEIDTTFYPIDLQTCTIKVENWCYTHQFVDLTNATDEVPLTDFYPHGLWDITGTEARREQVVMQSDPENPFPRVVFEIHLKRKPRYYVINIMVPCFFLTFIALLVYVLPPESGEKVSLGVTVLLAFSVFQFVIADHTPINSDCTPLLSIFVAATMGLSTMSVVTTVIVLYIHHEAAATPVPRWIQVVFFQYLSTLVCFGVYKPSTPSSRSASVASKLNGIHVDQHDNVTDNEMEEFECGDQTGFNKISEQDSNATEKAADSCKGCRHTDELRRIRKRLDRLAVYANMKTTRLTDQDEADAVSQDWHALAKIVDRLLLNITVICIILAIVWVVIYGIYFPKRAHERRTIH